MSRPERRACPVIHPAHWAAITDQVHRMMDVRSVLGCVRSALHDDDETEVLGAVSIAHDVLDDIINQFDSVALRAAALQWLAAQNSPARNE
jgi:hypothetical protein